MARATPCLNKYFKYNFLADQSRIQIFIKSQCSTMPIDKQNIGIYILNCVKQISSNPASTIYPFLIRVSSPINARSNKAALARVR